MGSWKLLGTAAGRQLLTLVFLSMEPLCTFLFAVSSAVPSTNSQLEEEGDTCCWMQAGRIHAGLVSFLCAFENYQCILMIATVSGDSLQRDWLRSSPSHQLA